MRRNKNFSSFCEGTMGDLFHEIVTKQLKELPGIEVEETIKQEIQDIIHRAKYHFACNVALT